MAKRTEVSTEQRLVEGFFTGFGRLWRALFGKKGAFKIGEARALELAAHWQTVEEHAVSAATHSLAITEADKLVDAALQELGVAGTTMGERLKAAKEKFSPELYQALWEAHKLRNTVAHEVGVVLHEHQVALAIATFKKTLRHLGVPV